MIKIMKYEDVPVEEIFARANPTADVSGIVRDIIADVRANGDRALYAYAEKSRISTSITCSKYVGSGAENSIHRPSEGWENPNFRAQRTCPCKKANFGGLEEDPYTSSPKTGCPRLAICTRI